jgi:hypothetical protein
MSTSPEGVGGRVGECQNDAFEVVNTKAEVDWSDHICLGTISVSESMIRALQISGADADRLTRWETGDF